MVPVHLVFIVLLISFGAVIMSLEIVSSNLMSPYFGGSVYIWGSIISSFMVHLSIGYVLGGYLAKRSVRIWVLLLILGVGSLWVILIPQMHAWVCTTVSDSISDVRYGSLLAMNLIFFLPITIMATVSPYVIGMINRYDKESWLSAGVVLFVSTFGSFLGTNVTAFYLLDSFPVSRIVMGLGAICLAVTALSLLLQPDRRWSAK